MRNKIDLYSKITIALVAALLTSQLLVQEVFLGYSPRIRPDLADSLVNKTLALININNITSLFQGKPTSSAIARTPEEAVTQLEKVSFKPTLVKGVYAKETENATLIQLRINEVDWVEVPYVRKSGKTEMLRIPKGSTPPPAGLY